eukprot:TRINITY_DN1607_c0_g2_i1.p2 TRINITY_DN1607_c0_g2~~TRINITY_DN1607_c0_g2_i1.p2  ORF type:complete len:353 (-),score=42.47 TRINITY_DN1607_c0_g2_i1:550-1608(-)
MFQSVNKITMSRSFLFVLCKVLMIITTSSWASQSLDASQDSYPCVWDRTHNECTINREKLLMLVDEASLEYNLMMQCSRRTDEIFCEGFPGSCGWDTVAQKCVINPSYLIKMASIQCQQSTQKCVSPFVAEYCYYLDFHQCNDPTTDLLQIQHQVDQQYLLPDPDAQIYWENLEVEQQRQTQQNPQQSVAEEGEEAGDGGGGGCTNILTVALLPIIIFFVLFAGILVCYILKRRMMLIRIERERSGNPSNADGSSHQQQCDESFDIAVIVEQMEVQKYEQKTDGNEQDAVCAICLEKFQEEEDVVKLTCLHQFHMECIEKWVQTKGQSATCPLCNRNLLQSIEAATALNETT